MTKSTNIRQLSSRLLNSRVAYSIGQDPESSQSLTISDVFKDDLFANTLELISDTEDYAEIMAELGSALRQLSMTGHADQSKLFNAERTIPSILDKLKKEEIEEKQSIRPENAARGAALGRFLSEIVAPMHREFLGDPPRITDKLFTRPISPNEMDDVQSYSVLSYQNFKDCINAITLIRNGIKHINEKIARNGQSDERTI